MRYRDIIIYSGRVFKAIVLFLLIGLNSIYAQNNNLRFEHITMKDGLSHSTVYCILQDSKGFMWFGTRAGGLNKYDAYSFKEYKYSREDSFSISGNQILSLCEDKNGNIWAGTRNHGLNRLDVETEQFHRYKADENDTTSILDNTIRAICLAADGNLWIGTISGLCLYDYDNDCFIRYGASRGLEIVDAKAIEVTSNGLLWIGGSSGLVLYDPINKKTLASFQHDENNPASISESQVETIIEDRKGRVWAGTRREGLNCLVNLEQGIFVRYTHDENNDKSIASDVVRTLYEDNKGIIWVGTKKALEQLMPEEQEKANPEFIHHVRIEGDEHSITQNSIFSFYADRQENFWVGFYSEGISYLYNGAQNFTHIKNNIHNPFSLSNNMVSCFATTNEGIWVGTQGGGLNLFNRKTGDFKHFRMDVNKAGSLTSDNVRTLCVDRDGDLWVGTYNGIHLYNKTSQQFEHYLSNSNIYSIIQGLDDEIWIGSTENLILLKKSTKEIKTYTHNPDDVNSISSNLIYSIFLDGNNELWIGTKSGLNYYNRAKDNFIQHNHERDDQTTLSESNAISICEDLDGNLWIATLDGLNKFDRLSKSFTRYGKKEGLPSSILSNLITDNSGFLWVTSVRGLSKLNPQASLDSAFNKNDFVIRNYDFEDGLQDVDFLQNSFYLSESGELFLGGINGYNIFNPESLVNNKLIPEVHIVDFKLFNKTVTPGDENSPLKKEIWATKEIELSYKQTFIGFDFVALNYTLPQNNQFAYMMEGFDKDWNYVGNKREALYTNLNPGVYNFKVKASNNDGVWNEKGTSVKIIVHPPWWEKLWFRGAMVLMLLALIIAIYYIRLNNLQKQKKILAQKVKERTIELEKAEKELQIQNKKIVEQYNNLRIQKKEIESQADLLKIQKKRLEETNASKDKFFSILAHDLKNPFSSMIGFLEVLREEYNDFSEQEKIEMIAIAHDSAKLILDLIENLLLWSRSQRGLMPYHPDKVHLATLIQKEVDLLKNMIAKKHIELKLSYQKADLEITADKNMLGMVIRNLVSNAIKFTRPQGVINIDVNETAQETLFKISDTGIGIPAEELNKLFHISTNYSRLGTEQERGTGLGLVLCQEFISEHHGRIWVESEEGKGSSFYFTIPLN